MQLQLATITEFKANLYSYISSMSPQLNFLLNFILNNYFIHQHCLIIISDNEFSYSGFKPAVKLKITNDSFDSSLITDRHFGCQGILIACENPAPIFVQFEKVIRRSKDRFNQRRFLIISNSLQSDLFRLQELDFVSDLLLITRSGDGFELKTQRYVGTNDYNQPILVDKFFSNLTFMYGGRNLYPNKLTNQQGRPLRMATFTYEPYSIVVGDSVESYCGSELTLAVQFGLRYNMTPVAVVNSEDYWGELYPNWTGSGLLGNLIMDRADFGFGAMSTWESCYRYFDLSKPVVRGGITCLVPAPKY